MSFVPAGEEEDSDSDGFIDSGSSSSYHVEPDVQVQNNYRRSGNEDVKGLKAKSVSWARSPPTKVGNGNQTPVSRVSEDAAHYFEFGSRKNVLTQGNLKIAAMKGNMELVKKCMEQGIPFDKPFRNGWTVLMTAANFAQPSVIEFLLSHGADPNFHSDMYTALMCACSASSNPKNGDNVAECVKLLADAGADVNAKDRFHTTPLMIASKEGHLSAVKELIRRGAYVNKQDCQGWTALTAATQRQHKSVILELLESGADCNIQHSDKLTVKDMAAHLPGDEMLALLERRPANIPTESGDSIQGTDKYISSSHCTLDSGDSNVKLTDLRYGEMEVFLLGLDLPHLVGIFQKQLIDLDLLMTLTEQDLVNAGVDQVGARKKILDAVQALHKKDWQPSSLVSIHFNKQICCADAVAMLANSAKHLRYMGSTVVYIREHLKRHPDTIMQPSDRVTSSQLLRHNEDTIKHLNALQGQLDLLKSELIKEMKKRSLKPPDLIEGPSKEKKSLKWKLFVGGSLVLSSCVAFFLWRDEFMNLIHSKM